MIIIVKMQGKSAFGHVRGSALRLQERVMPRLADMKSYHSRRTRRSHEAESARYEAERVDRMEKQYQKEE